MDNIRNGNFMGKHPFFSNCINDFKRLLTAEK